VTPTAEGSIPTEAIACWCEASLTYLLSGNGAGTSVNAVALTRLSAVVPALEFATVLPLPLLLPPPHAESRQQMAKLTGASGQAFIFSFIEFSRCVGSLRHVP
jgi:hypothetical protein